MFEDCSPGASGTGTTVRIKDDVDVQWFLYNYAVKLDSSSYASVLKSPIIL